MLPRVLRRPGLFATAGRFELADGHPLLRVRAPSCFEALELFQGVFAEVTDEWRERAGRRGEVAGFRSYGPQRFDGCRGLRGGDVGLLVMREPDGYSVEALIVVGRRAANYCGKFADYGAARRAAWRWYVEGQHAAARWLADGGGTRLCGADTPPVLCLPVAGDWTPPPYAWSQAA